MLAPKKNVMDARYNKTTEKMNIKATPLQVNSKYLKETD